MHCKATFIHLGILMSFLYFYCMLLGLENNIDLPIFYEERYLSFEKMNFRTTLLIVTKIPMAHRR
jgi:hypothetical protein